MGTACPGCGVGYERLGQHWHYNPDHRPSLTDHQHEIVVGLLMGDGCLNRGGKNPYLKVKMVSPNYLDYLDSQFGVLGTGVSLERTAAESAKHVRDRGFNPDADAKDYSDVYGWQSRCLPELHQYADWYTSGEKVWPADIALTPTTLKHWYCGDGHYENAGSHNCIRISMANEVDNTDKVEQLFENAGLPVPNKWKINKRPSGGRKCTAVFTVDQSKELWEYMGDPLPDFAYKWPESYR
jgi:hypothetical protein